MGKEKEQHNSFQAPAQEQGVPECWEQGWQAGHLPPYKTTLLP